jgi:hypothetical protein
MSGGGGRGGAALMAWMVALLFYNTNDAVCLLNVEEAANEMRSLHTIHKVSKQKNTMAFLVACRIGQFNSSHFY